eukprot:c17395_g1_i1 orf=13-462(+)
MRINTTKEKVTIINVYAPNNSREREELWRQIDEMIDSGKYVIMGDFNMIEQEQDKKGGVNAAIQGAEKVSWENVKWKIGLADMTDTEEKMMTWNNCRMEGRIEARLDRIYMLEGGNWIAGNHTIIVEQGEVLSDHKLVILEGKVQGEVR